MDLKELGRIGSTAGDCRWTLHCDALATGSMWGQDRNVYLISAVGPQTSVKAFKAMLLSGQPAQFWLEQPPENYRKYATAWPPFTAHVHRLAFDHWHLVAMSAAKEFLPSYSMSSVWRALKGPTVTTPLLRAWLSYVCRELKARGALRKLTCWNCSCGVLNLTPELVDCIVADGVKSGELQFVESAHDYGQSGSGQENNWGLVEIE